MKSAIEGALDRLVARVGDLDTFVAKELGYDPKTLSEYYSAEQVDGAAMAIDNMKRDSGMIIGDQGGIGKGRVVAAVIKWGIRQNLPVIFVTEKPNLFKDIVRDLVDIGEGTVHDWSKRAMMTNMNERVALDDEETVSLHNTSDKQRAKLTKLMSDGNLGTHDVIFTTYNQMQTYKGQRTIQQDFLEQFGDGAIVIFDESHNAGGTEAKPLTKGAAPGLNRATLARNIIARARGVFYSSATYAKRPQVMDLYSKTDMSKAVSNLSDLAPAIEKGGVPLQQAVAAMLAEAGQYTRRERDFAGMVYETVAVPVNKQKSEQTSGVMRSILAFDKARLAAIKDMDKKAKAEAKRISLDGTTGSAGVTGTNFTSLMHNLVGQMLLMLKVDGAVGEALSSLKADEKPVITLANTMGSFIESYVKDHGLVPGDAIGLSFGNMLRRYLERSRDVVVGKAFGPKQRHHLSDEELGEKGLRMYEAALELIQQTDWSGMPVSPIDYIKYRLKQEGYKTGEITGRQDAVEYKGDAKNPEQTYRKRPASEASIAGRSRTLVAFNNGTLDALIINQAGSTGLSIHASSKFKDQRKRVMIIAQPELNIDTHMQMLYRVDRTGQVVKPAYKQLAADIPAEKRPAAILSKKMASLNANTTAARGSAYEAKDTPDFMNEYGDEVVASLMEDNPDIHRLLDNPLKAAATSNGGLDREGATRKVTGRISLLSNAEQERIYDMIESEYSDLIQRLDAMGENALEAKTLDLDAKVIKKTSIFEGKGDSPFERGAWAEEVDVKRVGKPYTSEQVITLVQGAIKSTATDMQGLQRDGRAVSRNLANDVRSRAIDYRRSIVDDIEDVDRAKAQEAIITGMLGRWLTLNERLHPGATVRLDTPIGVVHGIVVKTEQKGKPNNPIALGSWRVTFAVADAMRQVTVPFSKLHLASEVDLNDLPANQYTYEPEATTTVLDRVAVKKVDVPVIQAFDLKQSQSREHRTILTGNLLAAFGRFQKGRIVNYTDDAGQVTQGIMMPADFNLEKALSAESVKFAQPEDIIRFLSEFPNSRLVTTPDNTLRLNYTHGSLRLATNSSKATGAQYFLNKTILDAANDEFVKSGANMQMLVDAAHAEDVIRAIFSQGYELETRSYKDEAKKIVAANPKNSKGERGSIRIGRRPTGYKKPPGPGPLRPLFDLIRGARESVRTSGVAQTARTARRKFRHAIGGLADIFVRNLSQLEHVNERTFDAALRAAGARTTGRMLMRRAANQVQEILETKDGWDLFRTALVESRLRGVKNRWLDLQKLSQDLDDVDLQDFYAGGGDDNQPGIRPIVTMLEGMPFGKTYKADEGFDKDDSLAGMIDTMLATDDFNAARAYLGTLFARAADSVASVMDPDDYDQFTTSSQFAKALPVYKELLERPMNEAHGLNEGVFSDALGPLDTYYPLTALDEDGNALHRIGTRVFRGNEYLPPKNPRNKMATGLSPTYDVTPEALGNAISVAERRNTVANLLKVAEREGLVKTLKRGEDKPHTIVYGDEEYDATTVAKGKDRTLFINGRVIHIPAPRLSVPVWLEKELRPILEDGDYSPGKIAAFVSRVNIFGMAGPIDAAAHTANVIGALVVGTPYVGTSIASKWIGNTPVTKLLNVWLQIATTDPWTDDAVKDIEEMTKIGVIPSRYATVTSGWAARGRDFAGQTGAKTSYWSLAPLLYGPAGIDIRARLLMYRLARHAMPGASNRELKRFIDQLGNYTFELNGRMERFLKEYAISPFYTAGSTMWRNGINATFGATPLPKGHNSAGKRSVLRIRMLLSGGIIGMLGAWVLMYKYYTDKWPWEDDRARLMDFPLNEKHRHHWLAKKYFGDNDKTAYVSMSIFSPLVSRGLRSTGATAYYNARKGGATSGQAWEETEREIANSFIHPFVSGPATHGAIVFTTTKEPYITGVRDLTGRRSYNFLPAMQTKEPGFPTLKARTVEGIAGLNSFYSDVARNIGFIREPLDLAPDHATSGKEGAPSAWLRMGIDLAFPRLGKSAVDLAKQRKRFETNAKAITSAVRRDAGLPPEEREKSSTDGLPSGPSGPSGPSKPPGSR